MSDGSAPQRRRVLAKRLPTRAEGTFAHRAWQLNMVLPVRWFSFFVVAAAETWSFPSVLLPHGLAAAVLRVAEFNAQTGLRKEWLEGALERHVGSVQLAACSSFEEMRYSSARCFV